MQTTLWYAWHILSAAILPAQPKLTIINEIIIGIGKWPLGFFERSFNTSSNTGTPEQLGGGARGACYCGVSKGEAMSYRH